MSDTPKKKKIIFVANPHNNANRSERLDVSTPEGRAVDRVKKVYTEKGLKNIDISELLGWRTPKTSKVFSGSQLVRMEDLQDMTYALCSAPEPFLQDKMNQSEYDKNREFQTLGSLVKEFCEPGMFTDWETLMRRDFPYVMCKTAALDPIRFVKRGTANEVADPFGEDGEAITRFQPEVYFYDRKVQFDDGFIPLVGYWLDAEFETLVLAICVCEKRGVMPPSGISNVSRDKYKGLLDVTDEETKEFQRFLREKRKFRSALTGGEIRSIVYRLNEGIPTNEQLEKDFKRMISDYARLIYEATGVEPNFGSSVSGYNTELFDISKVVEAISKSMGVDFLEEAKKEADYRCFFADEEGYHETFMDENGNPYVDTEFVIPMEAIPDFSEDLFIKENVVCLCPLCAAKLNNAQKDVKEDMIWSIYKAKKDGLKRRGIEISLGRITELWDI